MIIDDGSPDGTAGIVKRLQKEFPERLFMVERKGKLGLGTAYICGFKWAIEHKYDFIFEMDADFSHNPNDLPKLYAACMEQGGDVAVGSRYCNGVNVVNWPLGRVDVLLCFRICSFCYWNESTGYDSRFQMLSS